MVRNSFAETQYEGSIRRVFGSQWRTLEPKDRLGAIGVAIVKSVADGVDPNINDISAHLALDKETLFRPFRNLDLNGVFNGDRIFQDKKSIKNDDHLALCYYAGYASGDTGPVIIRDS